MNFTYRKETAALPIYKDDVEHVARLARLDLTEDEKIMYTDQLNAILKYVGQLNELDTDKVPPTSHVMHLVNVMREDVPRPSLTLEQVMFNAPDEEDGGFKVPAVLE